MERKQLRFAVICQNFKVNRWHLETLKKVMKLKDTELCAIISLRRRPSNKLPTISSSRILTRFLAGKVLQINCDLPSSNDMLKKIIPLQLDFILNLSNEPIQGRLLHIAKFGVWEFDYCDPREKIYSDNPVMEVSLRKAGQENKSLVLKKGHFSTIKYSSKQSLALLMEASSGWPALVCKDLLKENADYFSGLPDVQKMQRKNIQYGRLLLKLLKNKISMIYSKLFCYEYWNIGIIHRPIGSFLADGELTNIQWLTQDRRMYFADPFVYKSQQKYRLIMEQLDYKVVKGFISEATLSKPGEPVVLAEGTISSNVHMSYPFIVKHNGEVYCIPETSEAMEAAIFKLEQQTGEWKKIKSIIRDFPAVDSTLFNQGGYWWLFCTKANSNRQSHNNELYIFYASDLLGEWKHHVMNPVKIDIRSSRPAGTPFLYEGFLYRPAQNCSETYGGSISINRIKILSPSKFDEELVTRIEPVLNSPYPDGVHTITAAGGITIIDGKRLDFHFLHFFRKLYKYFPHKVKARTRILMTDIKTGVLNKE